MATDQQIIDLLYQNGVSFLTPSPSLPKELPDFPPKDILLHLAQHPDARMRLSLIPVFLSLPSYARQVNHAVRQTDSDTAITLKVYYAAAALLAQIYRPELEQLHLPTQHLTDHFFTSLGLASSTPEDQLTALSIFYQQHTHRKINWAGTFHHAAQRVIQRRAKEQQWTNTP